MENNEDTFFFHACCETWSQHPTCNHGSQLVAHDSGTWDPEWDSIAEEDFDGLLQYLRGECIAMDVSLQTYIQNVGLRLRLIHGLLGGGFGNCEQ